MSSSMYGVTIWDAQVQGVPRPQGSKAVGVSSKSGRAHIYDVNSAALRTWREQVAKEVAEHRPTRVKRPGAVAVKLLFYMPRKGPRALPTHHPDLDKLVRAVLDALTGVAFEDDSQVISLQAEEVFTMGDPYLTGARIRVARVTDPDAFSASAGQRLFGDS